MHIRRDSHKFEIIVGRKNYLILLHKYKKSDLWLSLKSKNRIDKAWGLEL